MHLFLDELLSVFLMLLIPSLLDLKLLLKLLHSDNHNYMIETEKRSAQIDVSILSNLSQAPQATI